MYGVNRSPINVVIPTAVLSAASFSRWPEEVEHSTREVCIAKGIKRRPREWVAVTSCAIAAGGAWGALAAAVARLLTPISEDAALLFVALPVALVVAAWLWPKLPKILGFR